jgi:hypothetical protein
MPDQSKAAAAVGEMRGNGIEAISLLPASFSSASASSWLVTGR